MFEENPKEKVDIEKNESNSKAIEDAMSSEEVENTESFIESNRKEIIKAAEDWINGEEEKLEKDKKGRLLKFATIGAGVAVSIESALAGLASTVAPYNKEEFIVIGVALILGAAAGGAAGALSGKFKNYLERKKFNKQKSELETSMGKETKEGKTFEEIKESLGGLNK